jgi:putative hemolysin
MDPIVGMILFFLLAIIVSFTCSVLEASLLSTPESYINMKIQEGSKSAKLLLKLKKNIDDPISAILTLNTCAHTIGAAGVGAEAEKVLRVNMAEIGSSIFFFNFKRSLADFDPS